MANQVLPKRYALLCGIANYNDATVGNLTSISKELEQLRQVLKGFDEGYQYRVEVLQDDELTIESLISKLESLAHPSEIEEVFFYLAGHGSVPHKKAYFRTYGASGRTPGIRLDELFDLLEAICSEHVVIAALDFCYAGAFVDVVPANEPENLAILASATRSQQASADGDPSFAGSLIKALNGEAADDTGHIRWGRVAETVCVAMETSFTQRPVNRSSHLTQHVLNRRSAAPLFKSSVATRRASDGREAEIYLSSLRTYCAQLPYLSLRDIRPRRNLSDIYVTLMTRDHAAGRKDAKELSVSQAMSSSDRGRMIVLGDPGSGKSSLLRHLAERAWDRPESIGLKKRHLPMLIPLSRIAGLDGSLEYRLAQVLQSELALVQDIPKGFISTWAENTETTWLFLFDGLDEVPEEYRARFLPWLDSMLTGLSPHKFVLTSRLSGYHYGDISLDGVKHYDLLPLSQEQTDELAQKWLGDQAADFVLAFSQTYAARLQRTPLTITIAAKVFSEEGELPERQSSLYTTIVDILLAECKQRGLSTQLGARIFKLTRGMLATIGYTLASADGEATEIFCRQALTTYIQRTLKISRDEADADALQFVNLMCARSGLLVRRSANSIGFIHPTFQEYFAAVAVRQKYGNNVTSLWSACVSHWQKKEWREIALFLLGLIADAEEDATPLVHLVLQGTDAEHIYYVAENAFDVYDLIDGLDALIFATEALGHNVPLTADELDNIADCELAIVEAVSASELVELEEGRQGPFEALRLLNGSKRAVRGLRDLSRDTEKDNYVQFLAFQVLLDLAPTRDDLVALSRLGAHIINSKSGDPETAFDLCMDITDLLLRHNRRSEAAKIVSALIDQEFVSVPNWFTALEYLIELTPDLGNRVNLYETFRTIAQNPRLTQPRLEYVISKIDTYSHENAVKILLEMISSGNIGDWRRCDAAVCLSSIGEADMARSSLATLSRTLNDSYARHYAETRAWPQSTSEENSAEANRLDHLEELDYLEEIDTDQLAP